MSEAKDPKSPPPQRSHGLLKAFLGLVMLAFLAAVGWVTYLHWSTDGHWSFDIFDAPWWHPGIEASQPVIDSATRATSQVTSSAHDAVWGDHGLAEEAGKWWHEHVENRPKPALTPQQVASDRSRLERDLADAENEFARGLDQYRKAGDGTATAAHDHALEARAHFLATQDLLTRTMPAYQQVTGYDHDRYEDAKALQDYNQRLLTSVSGRLDAP